MKLDKVKKLKADFNEKVVRKDWHAALSLLDEMMEETFSCHYKKGMILYQLCRYGEAISCMSRVLEFDPDKDKAANMIKKCQEKIKEQEAQILITPNNTVNDFETTPNNLSEEAENNLIIEPSETFCSNDTYSSENQEFGTNEFMLTTEETMQLTPSQHEKVQTNEDFNCKKTQVIQKVKKEKNFSGYKILAELGRGGMGIVYKVYDPKLDRTAALKVLISGTMAHEKEIQRFLREIKTTAKLKHPNIITLYETGVFQDYNYFTMDFIDGFPLRKLIKEEAYPLKKLIQITMQVAEAVHYAHEQGIIHRDLKPDNIMLENDTLIPKVMDFGLAKSSNPQENLSQTHELLGTPAYMSPEQAEGTKVNHSTDVYALGIILYEILAKRVPFQGHTLSSILQQIFNDDPIPPRTLNPEIPIDLEIVCLKCLEKKPIKRYSSAKLLANDLNNYLTQQPISAKPPSKILLMRKFVMRHRILFTIICTILCMISVWGTYSFVKWVTTERQRKQAILQNAQMMLWQARKSSMSNSWRKCGVFSGMALELVKDFPDEEVKSLRNEAKSYVRTSIIQHGALWESKSSAIKATKVAYQKGGNHLATASYDGDIHIWDLQTGQKSKTLTGHFGPVTSVSFASDNRLISSSHDNTIRIWNVENGKQITKITGHDNRIVDIEISPDEKVIASGSHDQSICIWDIKTGALIRKIQAHNDKIEDIDFSPDGTLLASCSSDKTIKIWDYHTGKEIAEIAAHDDIVTDIAFMNDEEILSSSHDKTIKLWDIQTGKIKKVLKTEQKIYDISKVSEKLFAVASHDGNIHIWDLQTGEVHASLGGHTHPVLDIECSENSQEMFSTSLDNTLRIWDLKTHQEKTNIEGHSDYVYAISFSPDDKILASGSHDNTIRLWNVSNGKLARIISTKSKGVQCIAFSPDGKTLASGSIDSTINLWNMEDGSLLEKFTGHQGAIQHIEFSHDGLFIASASGDGTIQLWDTQSKKSIATFNGHEHIVTKISFSADSTLLASASYDKTVKIWDIKKRRLVHNLTGHSNIVFGVDFSPNNKFLASCSEDTTIKIWHVKSGKMVTELAGHEDIVYDVKFHPHRRMLASSSEDKSIKLWDIKTGVIIREIYGHQDIVVSLDFSHDGTMLASSSEDHTIRLWDITQQDIPYTVKKHDAEVYSIAYSSNGKILASATGNNEIYLLDLVSKKTRVFQGHGDRVRTVLFDKSGEKLISCSSDATIRVWDVATGKQIHEMTGHEGEIYQINLHPIDNESIVSASSDHSIRIWNINTGEQIKKLVGHTDFVYAAEISPDGKKIASFAHDKIIGIWDFEKKIPLDKFQGHTAPGYCLQFNHKGNILVSCSVDQTIRFWDVETGKELKKLLADSTVATADFSADDKILATGLYNGYIILWEMETGTPIRKVKAHDGPIYWLTFSPDGKILASSSEDKTIRFWNVKPTKIIKTQNNSIHHSIASQFPEWQRQTQVIPDSVFNYRLDVPGHFIEQNFENNPKLITQILFALKVKNNFNTEEFSLEPTLFNREK